MRRLDYGDVLSSEDPRWRWRLTRREPADVDGTE